jgi:hypothetical protein
MKATLIALAAAFGLLFAVAEAGFAQDRAASARSGKIEDKAKRSLPLRTAPQPAPETRGGTLDAGKGEIIYF